MEDKEVTFEETYKQVRDRFPNVFKHDLIECAKYMVKNNMRFKE